MKISKLFRTLALTLTLAAIGAVIPATPALAVEEVYLYPESGPVGTEVYIAAVGIGSTSATAYIRFDSPTSTTDQIRITLASDGSYEGVFEIPDSLDGGLHEVYVYRSSTYYGYATFTVTPQLLSIEPEEGFVGDTITLEGNGFSSSSPSVYVYWDDVKITPQTGSTVNSSGELSNFKITIPAPTRGEHIIRRADSYHHPANEIT